MPLLLRSLCLLILLCIPSLAPAEEVPEEESQGDAKESESPQDTSEEGPQDEAKPETTGETAPEAEPTPPAEAAPTEPPPEPAEAPSTADRIEELDARVDALVQRLEEPPARRYIPRLKLTVGGRFSTEVRFRVQERSIGDWTNQQTLPVGIARNENIAKIKLDASVSRFKGVLEMDFVLMGLPEQPEGLAALSTREQLHPYRLEFHAAYLQARDLFTRGLDLRIGQQLVQWGVGDQFNPTNTLNANDMEDTVLFGEQQANLMVKLDYTLLDLWTFSGVLIPVFRPALVPSSGSLAVAAVDRLPFLDPAFRWTIHSQNAMARSSLNYSTVVTNVTPELPEPTPENMQFAFRIAGIVAKQDIAISYYNGFSDFPQSSQNVSSVNLTPACENDPAPPAIREEEAPEDEDCINGYIETETRLRFPRIQVLGFNLSGEIPVIGMGYRFELGVYFPKAQEMSIYNPDIPPFISAGEYDYDGDGEAGGPRPLVASSKPFAKWSLGLDYSLGPHLMINAQWVHGLADEFGAGDWLTKGPWVARQGSAAGHVIPGVAETESLALLYCSLEQDGEDIGGERCATEILRPRVGDYLVFGLDLNFARRAGLLRVFTLWDLSGYRTESWDMEAGERVATFHSPFSKEGLSAVIFPSLSYNFGHGFELTVGALLQLGKDYSKFGDPAAGGHQVFFKGQFSY